eukprot:6492301-Amphidinium_carterae.5
MRGKNSSRLWVRRSIWCPPFVACGGKVVSEALQRGRIPEAAFRCQPRTGMCPRVLAVGSRGALLGGRIIQPGVLRVVWPDRCAVQALLLHKDTAFHPSGPHAAMQLDRRAPIALQRARAYGASWTRSGLELPGPDPVRAGPLAPRLTQCHHGWRTDWGLAARCGSEVVPWACRVLCGRCERAPSLPMWWVPCWPLGPRGPQCIRPGAACAWTQQAPTPPPPAWAGCHS